MSACIGGHENSSQDTENNLMYITIHFSSKTEALADELNLFWPALVNRLTGISGGNPSVRFSTGQALHLDSLSVPRDVLSSRPGNW